MTRPCAFTWAKPTALGFIEEVPLNAFMEAFANVMTRGDGLLKGTRAQLQKLLVDPSGNAPSQFRFLPALPVQESIEKAIDSMDPETRSQAITTVEWQRGDLALIDNMALAHVPAPSTQTLPLVSGLRVFHRTTMTNPKAVPRNLRGAAAVAAGRSKEGWAHLQGGHTGSSSHAGHFACCHGCYTYQCG